MLQGRDLRLQGGGPSLTPALLASRGIERKVGALDIAGSPGEGGAQEAATDEDLGDVVADPAGAVGKPSSSDP